MQAERKNISNLQNHVTSSFSSYNDLDKTMKHILTTLALTPLLAMLPTMGQAQKHNLYINYAGSFQINNDSRDGNWSSRFYNRHLRIEMKGHLTDNLYYRFRHRLNKNATAMGGDGFAKATDYMMVGWKINEQWAIQGGKKNQALGSFEYDEPTVFVYQFSDIEDNVDGSKAAINLLFNATPNQQFTAEVCNTYNGKLDEEFGADATVTNGTSVASAITASSATATPTLATEKLETANTLLSYNVGWNGTFCDGKLQTRWSYTLRTQAQNKYSRFLRLGQKLNLSKLQWYFDYNMTYDDLDRMGIATREVAATLAPTATNLHVGKVLYQGCVTKMFWQWANNWNLVLKGMYETASLTKNEQFKNYRKALGYVGSIEYYPARKQQQDLRLFLAYTGRQYIYSTKSQLSDYNTNRIELGMMYRLKLL